MHSHPQTLETIKSSLQALGDLPIFSASVNRIAAMSESQDADAMQLSMEVMKDASLSVKLMRLVNSSYYNRSGGTIGAISQAVMILGFETVKNVSLTLKLLDSFSDGKSELDLNSMLVHAYLSATLMRELAIKGGIDKIEQSYMCGLLHNLGEIIVAYTLPDRYLQIVELVEKEELAWVPAQQQVLECTFDEIVRDLAEAWGFSPLVINSIGRYEEISGQVKNVSEFNRHISSQANLMMASLYLKPQRTTKSFTDLLTQMHDNTGIPVDTLRSSLTKAFHMGCDLAKEFNLNKRLLSPRVVDTGDNERDRLAKQFAYYAQSIEVPKNARRGEEAATSDSAKLLQVMSELTTLMSQKADLSVVFNKLIEGLKRGVGLERIALCLLTAKRDQYSARLVVGRHSDKLKSYFHFPVDKEKDLFSKVIFEGLSYYVGDAQDPQWRALLPADFEQSTGSSNFMVAAFGDAQRPLGMIYADMAGDIINKSQYESFQLLVNHAKLALNLR